MIYQTYRPRSPLSQFVEFFWYREADNLPKIQTRLLPIGAMELVINLHEDTIPLFNQHNRIQCGSTNGSRICGTHSQGFIIESDRQVSVIGVHFKPGGSIPFLPFPAGELHNQIVSLDQVWHHHAGELREILLATPTLETRFLILEKFLIMMAQPPKRHPAVDFALREFKRSPESTLGALTDKIGLSTRHFNQLFRAQVGLTPKLFCRIQRLQQVLNLLARKEQVDWSDVALTCGYFDQAHFIHDFQTFGGCTPREYLKQRGFHPCHVVLTY